MQQQDITEMEGRHHRTGFGDVARRELRAPEREQMMGSLSGDKSCQIHTEVWSFIQHSLNNYSDQSTHRTGLTAYKGLIAAPASRLVSSPALIERMRA